MSEQGQGRYMRREIMRLTEENEALSSEVDTLRGYLSGLHALMEAVEQIDPSTTDINPLLDQILYNALVVIQASDGSMLVVDDETGELVFVLSRGSMPQDRLAGIRIPTGKGIAGWVAANRKPAIVNNTEQDDRFYGAIDRKISYRTHSVLAVPIIGYGEVLGVIEIINKNNGLPFNEMDQLLLTILCRFAGEVLHAKLEDANDSAEEVSSAAYDGGAEAPADAPAIP